jgi:hypothetical protein
VVAVAGLEVVGADVRSRGGADEGGGEDGNEGSGELHFGGWRKIESKKGE